MPRMTKATRQVWRWRSKQGDDGTGVPCTFAKEYGVGTDHLVIQESGRKDPHLTSTEDRGAEGVIMSLELAYRVKYGKNANPAKSGWCFFMQESSFYVFDEERLKIVRLRGTNRMRCAACGGSVAFGDRVLGCSGRLCSPYELPIRAVLRAMAKAGIDLNDVGFWTRIKLEEILTSEGREPRPRRDPDRRLRRITINN